jgi:hypothetical protein
VSHADRWFKKAQRLSKELLLSAPYPQLVHALGQLAEGVSETTKLVQSQEVNFTPVNKSFARNLKLILEQFIPWSLFKKLMLLNICVLNVSVGNSSN